MNAPFAPFLSILTMPYGYVYPKEAVDYYKENFGFHIIGTGPFKFERWDLDKELVFDKNDYYWAKDSQGNKLPNIDGFVVSFIRSSETEFLDFRDKKLSFEKPSIDVFGDIVDANGSLKSEFDFELVKSNLCTTIRIKKCSSINCMNIKGNIIT